MNKGRDIVRERTKYSLLSTIIGLGLTVVGGAIAQDYMDKRNEPKIEAVQEEREYTPEQIRQIEEQSIKVMNNMPQRLEEKVEREVIGEEFTKAKPYETPVRRDYKTKDFSEDSDAVLLARTIYGESDKRTSKTEMAAIGYTVLTRASDGKEWNGESVRGAILETESLQYHCFLPHSGVYKELFDPEIYDKKRFSESLEVAEGILSGRIKNPAPGATHYLNPDEVSKMPYWADKIRKLGRIKTEKGLSAHVFYRED